MLLPGKPVSITNRLPPNTIVYTLQTCWICIRDGKSEEESTFARSDIKDRHVNTVHTGELYPLVRSSLPAGRNLTLFHRFLQEATLRGTEGIIVKIWLTARSRLR